MITAILVIFGIITLVNFIILYILEIRLSVIRTLLDDFQISKIHIDDNKHEIDKLKKINEEKAGLTVIQDKNGK